MLFYRCHTTSSFLCRPFHLWHSSGCTWSLWTSVSSLLVAEKKESATMSVASDVDGRQGLRTWLLPRYFVMNRSMSESLNLRLDILPPFLLYRTNALSKNCRESFVNFLPFSSNWVCWEHLIRQVHPAHCVVVLQTTSQQCNLLNLGIAPYRRCAQCLRGLSTFLVAWAVP